MTTVYIIGALVMQIGIVAIAIAKLRKNLLDFGALNACLFIVFYALPAWDLIGGGGYFPHETVIRYGISMSVSQMVLTLFVTTGIMLLFLIGYAMGPRLSGRGRVARRKVERGFDLASYCFAQVLLLGVWLFIMYRQYIAYGENLFRFLLPSRKYLTYSGAVENVKDLLPMLAWILYLMRPKAPGGRRRLGIFYALICFATVMSGGQRRDVFVIALFFIMVLLNSYGDRLKERFLKVVRSARVRRTIFVLGMLLLLAIPILWYARVISTNYVRSDKIIDAWNIRGFTELLFGSSSTGFETTLVLHSYSDLLNIPPLHSLAFILFSWVPRFVMPDKPMLLTAMLKDYRGDSGNLSSFFVNDMLFSFGWLCLLIVPLIGVLIYHLYQRGMESDDPMRFYLSAYMFSNIVMFFKNGFTQFAVALILFWLGLWVACSIVYPVQKPFIGRVAEKKAKSKERKG